MNRDSSSFDVVMMMMKFYDVYKVHSPQINFYKILVESWEMDFLPWYRLSCQFHIHQIPFSIHTRQFSIKFCDFKEKFSTIIYTIKTFYSMFNTKKFQQQRRWWRNAMKNFSLLISTFRNFLFSVVFVVEKIYFSQTSLFRNFWFSRASTNQLISHIWTFNNLFCTFFRDSRKFLRKIIRRNLETASLTQLVSRITTFFLHTKKIYMYTSRLFLLLRVYILSRFWADAEAEKRVAKAQ